MTALDRDRLLAFLRRRAESPTPTVHAVRRGLIERVERGDFDRPRRPREEE